MASQLSPGCTRETCQLPSKNKQQCVVGALTMPAITLNDCMILLSPIHSKGVSELHVKFLPQLNFTPHANPIFRKLCVYVCVCSASQFGSCKSPFPNLHILFVVWINKLSSLQCFYESCHTYSKYAPCRNSSPSIGDMLTEHDCDADMSLCQCRRTMP